VCGIAGSVSLGRDRSPNLAGDLRLMNRLLRHRGPDGSGLWTDASGKVGLSHNRLSIIDLDTGEQPMHHGSGTVIVYNGEIYNYIELREELGHEQFRTSSDTEAILAAYERWGEDCVDHLRGMFAFALWDPSRGSLFCARDRFGIKPFYYAVVGDSFYFASEAKALLPFLAEIRTDSDALKDYLTFQFVLGEKTLFAGVSKLEPGQSLTIEGGHLRRRTYWEVQYALDFDHTDIHFARMTRELLEESVRLHMRSDVPVGAYVSGGLDSSIVAGLAAGSLGGGGLLGFTGTFREFPGYDESRYAGELARMHGFDLHEVELGSADFLDSIASVIYHLDYPVAGPGSFPQFHVSRLAARQRKVVLGGQGGDEVFGGYVRYLIGYFEQCIKAAIDGTMHSGNFVVTYESIIPNLVALKSYKPLLREFWREGLFDELDRRYFRLVDRSPDWGDEVDRAALGSYSPFESFRAIFHNPNVGRESYFDKMTHFDFRTLLPALLHVEDRMSMAHGLESRVPLLDHKLVEKIATAPADVKFKNGELKRLLRRSCGDVLPASVRDRTDKMGFPVPLSEWLKTSLHDFVADVFRVGQRKGRPYFNYAGILDSIGREAPFGRKLWGLLCLELWQQQFHDRADEFRLAAATARGSSGGAEAAEDLARCLAVASPTGRPAQA
jgi:asparagine synthase (glutamine-hydrolysing)